MTTTRPTGSGAVCRSAPHTAEAITAQQQRVRRRYPDAPIGTLKLLPARWRNPDGERSLTVGSLEQRHREWVDALPALRTDDGAEFDKTRAVLYAYRHTYAQRHADAGVAIDVLAELLPEQTDRNPRDRTGWSRHSARR